MAAATFPPPIPAPHDGAGWLAFLVGIGLTVALVAGLVAIWPADDAPVPLDTGTPPTTLMTAEAAAAFPGEPGLPGRPGGTAGSEESSTATTITVDLFAEGPQAAVAELLAAAGSPDRLFELTIYEGYLFVAYADPTRPDSIDRRLWRNGLVGSGEPNPIDDRVDADTTRHLFGLEEIDLARIPALVTDAPSHYDVPVRVSHVIIDRFLPFDQRVLVRVYAQPIDGRAGGGYISYTVDGTLVKTCC